MQIYYMPAKFSKGMDIKHFRMALTLSSRGQHIS